MQTGWVKLHRKSIDSRVFSDAELWKLWTWCLMRANHADRYFEGVLIPRGSFVAGTRSAAEILGSSPTTVHRQWKRLAEWNMISLKAERGFTVITICNFDTYNGDESEDETPMERKRNADETLMKRARNADETRMEPNKNYQELQEPRELEKTNSLEPPKAASKPAAPPLPSMLDFPTVGDSPTWSLTMPVVQSLRSAFPSMDILAECRKAKAWCEANPTKRKTPRGMQKFLFAWMERNQNRGSPKGGGLFDQTDPRGTFATANNYLNSGNGP